MSSHKNSTYTNVNTSTAATNSPIKLTPKWAEERWEQSPRGLSEVTYVASLFLQAELPWRLHVSHISFQPGKQARKNHSDCVPEALTSVFVAQTATNFC